MPHGRLLYYLLYKKDLSGTLWRVVKPKTRKGNQQNDVLSTKDLVFKIFLAQIFE